MTLPSDKWWTEIDGNSGTAFSLAIRRKLHEEQTPFQRIEVYETETFGNLMVIDDCVMLTQRDNFLYHEMMSHPALFAHPNPRDVLIIGGGDCGTLREVLKHDTVVRADQVEIDERVTRVAEQFFPELCSANSDPRAHLHFEDGIKWVEDAEPGTYDVIIVDSTDPVGPAEGLFRRPFYQNCLRALRAGGLLVQQTESPLLHSSLIRAVRSEMRAAGFGSVLTLNFPQCVYPSGWWTATMAGKDNPLTNIRDTEVADRNFSTSYYNLAIHQAAMAQPEFFRKEILDQG